MSEREVLTKLKEIAEANGGFRMPIEDMFLLLNIHNLTQNPEDDELAHLINWYYKGQVYYDRLGADQALIDWGIRVKVLEKHQFLSVLPNAVKPIAGKTHKAIDINKLEVNEKFITMFKLQGKDMYWDFLLDRYGRKVFIKDSTIYTNVPDSEAIKQGLKTEEDVMNLFWKTINNGDIQSYRTMLAVVDWAVKNNSCNYAVSRFFREYPGLLKNYQKEHKL